MRRASVLRDLGRFHEAHRDLSRALPYFRRAGDTVWEARSLTHRAVVFLGLGLPGRAAADWARAEEMYATSGQEFEYAKARHNRGCVALIRGDLPEALTYFDEAGSRYDELGENMPELAIDRCSALLAAGLAEEAARETDAALSRLPLEGGIAYRKAELLFAAATAALAAGHPADARQRATQAHRLFRAQGRALWQARAALVLAEARYAAGEHSAALLRYAEEAAARLDATRSGEAMQAHLLAGRIALGRGSVAVADPHLERAARSRRRGPPLPRSVAWLARALQADAQGNARATVAACARGPRRPRGAPDAARGHRVARVRHGAWRRARHAGPARRAQAWRRPPAAVLERAMAGDRAGRPEHTAPRRQGASGRARSAAQREPTPSGRPRWPPRAGTPSSANGGGSRRRSRPARAGCPAPTNPGKAPSASRALRRARPE